jgi:hypothetical protein
MKKFILLAGMMLACVTGFAQMQPGLFSITPKMGVNIASMTSSGKANSRIAIAAGLDFEYQINRQFSFGLGTIYSQQGVSDDPWTLMTDYLNLPFTINYYPVRGLGLYVGLEPGIKLRGKAEYSYGQQSGVVELKNTYVITNNLREANKEKFVYDGIFAHKDLGAKRGVLSLPIGVNYEFDHCVFGIKYNIGLGPAVTGSGVSCSHNVFQISLGYRFNVFGDVKKVEFKKEKEENKEK